VVGGQPGAPLPLAADFQSLQLSFHPSALKGREACSRQ
jgi:hypothetical protein